MTIFIPKNRNCYYVKARVRGKQVFKSLKTTNKAAASKRARAYVQAIEDGRWEDVAGVTKRAAAVSLGEVRQRYLAWPGAPKSAVQAVNALWRICHEVFPGRDPAELRVDEVFREETALRFEDAVRARMKEIDGHVSRQRAENGAEATLRIAKGVTKAKVRRAYHGLALPDLDGWQKCRPFRARVARSEELPAAVRSRVAAAAEGELRLARPDLYLAYCLGVYAGLRTSEILAARWDWVEADEVPVLCVRVREESDTKGHDSRRIPLPPAVWARMLAVRGAGEYIVPGSTPTARHRAVYREIQAWLRSLGVEPQKGKVFYRLRADFLVRVERAAGLQAAADAAGHDDLRVLRDHYLSLKQFDPLVVFPEEAARDVG